jgi:hypothetical protein
VRITVKAINTPLKTTVLVLEENKQNTPLCNYNSDVAT